MNKRPKGTGSIFRKPGSRFWWIGYVNSGQRQREATGSLKKCEAEALLKKRLAEIQTGSFLGHEIERIRVEQLAPAFLDDYRVNAKDIEFAERCWKHLRPVFGQMHAARLNTDHVNRYILQRRAEGASNATINRELACLKRMFNLAARSTPPKVARVPSFPPRLKESAPRSGFVDSTQYRRLVEQNPPVWLRTMLALAYSFGFRKEELLSLKVRQVDLLNRTLSLDPGTTKNDEGRMVKLTQETYQLLLATCVRGKRPEDYVLTRADGQPILDFRRAWYKLTDAAGLVGLLFHDLRRSAVRNMIRSGIPERVAMAISGHKSRSVFDRYNIVSEADLADAARRLDKAQIRHSTAGNSAETSASSTSNSSESVS